MAPVATPRAGRPVGSGLVESALRHSGGERGESFWYVPCTGAVCDGRQTGGDAAVLSQLWDSERWS